MTQCDSKKRTVLSIIIPAFNEEKLIGRTLNRITHALHENRDEAFLWETIVCDNNSTDRTAEIASRAGAKVVFEPINQISRARNRGASVARGEWLLFVDADSFPPPGLIKETLDLIRSGDYVGCGSTIQVEDGPLWFKLSLEGHNWEMRFFNACWGLFILSQAEAFWSIGGFSTDLYVFEEMVFVNRLKKYGRRNRKKFTVLHRHPVITSGRKGTLYSKWSMVTSIVTAMFYGLTKRMVRDTRRLSYWYDGRR